MALVEQIGLKGTEKQTAREHLSYVIEQALADAPSSFACERQQYGSLEEFETAPALRATKATVKASPRYYLVGEKRGPRDRITMKDQSNLCSAIQGKMAARINNTETIKRRQAGWNDWGEGRDTAESRAFQKDDLPAILTEFAQYLEEPDDRKSVEKELRTILFQSNLIGNSSGIPSRDDSTNESASAIPAGAATDDDSPPAKKQKLAGRPPRSVTPNNSADKNDPWLLKSLQVLASTDM